MAVTYNKLWHLLIDRGMKKKDLKEAMEVLSEQQKKVVYYRYFADLTQSKIAEMMGVSQMQVSRLEKSALEKIRGLMKVAEH